jgi:hypothetical protein
VGKCEPKFKCREILLISNIVGRSGSFRFG